MNKEKIPNKKNHKNLFAETIYRAAINASSLSHKKDASTKKPTTEKTWFQVFSNKNDVNKIKDKIHEKLTQHELKELYLNIPEKHKDNLLHYIHAGMVVGDDKDKKMNKEREKSMEGIFSDFYKVLNEEKNKKIFPFDELFLWSLTLYNGYENKKELTDYYLKKSEYPIACCLVAMVLYNNLETNHHIPDELKPKLKDMCEKYERNAIGILHTCYENVDGKSIQIERIVKKITHDLLLVKLELFNDHTLFEIAFAAEAYNFIATSPVQDLLNDIWFERINSDVSFLKISACIVFLPLTLYFHDLFKPFQKIQNKDEKKSTSSEVDKNLTLSRIVVYPTIEAKPKNLNNEKVLGTRPMSNLKTLSTNQKPKDEKPKDPSSYTKIPNTKLHFRKTMGDDSKNRILLFIETPLIKFIYHFIFYVLFLIIYLGFILFDYYPVTGMYPSDMTEYNVDSKFNVLKITLTEVVLYIWVLTFQIDYIMMFIQTDISIRRQPLHKIQKFFTDHYWNIFDIFPFLTFYIAVILRFIPKTSGGCLSTTESCFEAGRVMYCFSLILWFSRTLKFLIILSFWGSNLVVIGKMAKQLLVFVVLLFLFAIPFGASFQSILEKTAIPSVTTITTGFNRVYWPIFGELGGILGSINTYQCPDGNSSCTYGLYSFFLYIGLAIYIVICNLLILNMIIAIFGSTVEETQAKSMTVFKFQRFSIVDEYYKKTVLPPPFTIIEYIINIFLILRHSKDHFWNKKLKIKPEIEYNDYEKSRLGYYKKLTEEKKELYSNGVSHSETTKYLIEKLRKETEKRMRTLEKNVINHVNQVLKVPKGKYRKPENEEL